MPDGKCPLCGSLTHYNVSDVRSWYERRYLGVEFGSLVPARSALCWPELEKGDEVEVRSGNPHTRATLYGRQGTISRVVHYAADGTIKCVSIDGSDEAFIRSDLKKLKTDRDWRRLRSAIPVQPASWSMSKDGYKAEREKRAALRPRLRRCWGYREAR